jgi:nucleotide-binding universal stress UspA family protein
MAVGSRPTENLTAITQVFHSILVATDFSEAPRRALSGALASAAHIDVQASGVHVFENDRHHGIPDNPPKRDRENSDGEQPLARIKSFEAIGENRCSTREARTGGGGSIVSPA